MDMNEKSEYICRNSYCKSKYMEIRKNYYSSDRYKTCKKCRSFNEELSDGVTFNKKQYSGERYDNKSHETQFKFSDYIKGRWGKKWEK